MAEKCSEISVPEVMPEDLPEALLQVTDCLRKSNMNVIHLKQSILALQSRESELIRSQEVLRTRYVFSERMLKDRSLHLVNFYSHRIEELKEKHNKDLAENEEIAIKMEQEIDELASKNFEFQKRIKSLEEEKAVLMNSMTQETVWKQRIHRTNTDLSIKIEQIEKIMAELQLEKQKNIELEEIRKSIQEKLQEEAEKYKNTINSLEDEKLSLKDQLWTLQNTTETLNLRTEAYRKEIEDLKENHSIQIKNYIDEIDSLKEALNKTLKESELKLSAKYAEFEERLSSLHSQLMPKDKEIASLNSKISELQTNESSLKTQMFELSSTHNTLKIDYQTLLQEKRELAENSLKVNEESNANLKSIGSISKKQAYAEILLWKAGLLEISKFHSGPQIEDQLRGIIGVAPERINNYEPELKEYVDGVIDAIKALLSGMDTPSTPNHISMMLTEVTEKYRFEMAERRRLNDLLQNLRGNIRVMCRVRPLLKSEKGTLEIVQVLDTCKVRVINTETRRDTWFEYDRVFNPLDSQSVVYYEASDIVNSVLNGFNCCVMVYGQTGSGKTYTMEGTPRALGLIYRAVREVFEIIDSKSETHTFELSLCMLEVYNESIRDLLRPQNKKLSISDNNRGTMVNGAHYQAVKNYDEIVQTIELGNKNRAVGSTSLNEHSSRSHSIVTLCVRSVSCEGGGETFSKLNLIDLAGSERIAKSEVEGIRMREAVNINSSLSALANVLCRLAVKDKHIPYRNSKLTHILKDSLNGDAKTLVILNVSPLPEDMTETLSTLTLGTRMASVEKGKAKVNSAKKSNTEINSSPPTKLR